ncbi:MAG: phosphoribosylformylglycinamidine cyclo-ligase [Syntrophothermus sp.]|uniref:phosphoribosylformylglycinamidine cyclo-ligase n=1 Tax=Syntrophothermus sp. TaxID=2736299 RepID=UPI0025799B1E|nr:phosphoribosylformylglycinamidine cyclo-ligase [Syntrophothermus sp.]NSW82920.1 phosphoribosylformylglycinamidine cyclo-ligase [Syntrophothermus sp.]
MSDGFTYKKAGVDLEAADRSVELIRPWVKMTNRPEVLADIGAFAGFFALDLARFPEPVLVSGTDGVGTKLRIAQMMGIHDTVGIDLVAMCVNDILVHGAEPLFFLDYIAVGRLVPEVIEALVKGVAQGCVEAGCALVGGETAEMPGMYGEDEYDLAGFAVGAVNRSRLIDGSRVGGSQVIVGLPSSGMHSNGFSLARKVLLEKAGFALEREIDVLGRTLGEELLIPTRIYVRSVLKLLSEIEVKGMAHITGGGIPGNLKRILPKGWGALIEKSKLPVLPVFQLIQEAGGVEEEEMFRAFNMGIGFVLIVDEAEIDQTVSLLQSEGEKPIVIGKIIPGIEGVVIK